MVERADRIMAWSEAWSASITDQDVFVLPALKRTTDEAIPSLPRQFQHHDLGSADGSQESRGRAGHELDDVKVDGWSVQRLRVVVDSSAFLAFVPPCQVQLPTLYPDAAPAADVDAAGLDGVDGI